MNFIGMLFGAALEGWILRALAAGPGGRGEKLKADEDLNTPACLRNVLLSDSKVLGWQQSANSVAFLIEASIWPGHPHYEPPKPEEWGRACYKQGRLVFDGIEHVHGLLPQERVDPDLDLEANGWKLDRIDVDTLEPQGFFVRGRFEEAYVDVHILGGTMNLTFE